MRDESIDQPTPLNQEATPLDQPTLEDQEAAFERALDLRVVRVLEDPAAMEIPLDFAARVAAKVPSRRAAAHGHAVLIRRTKFGYIAMLLSALALVASLVLLAAHGRTGLGHPGVVLMVEWLLFAQFTGLAVWLSLRRASLR